MGIKTEGRHVGVVWEHCNGSAHLLEQKASGRNTQSMGSLIIKINHSFLQDSTQIMCSALLSLPQFLSSWLARQGYRHPTLGSFSHLLAQEEEMETWKIQRGQWQCPQQPQQQQSNFKNQLSICKAGEAETAAESRRGFRRKSRNENVQRK